MLYSKASDLALDILGGSSTDGTQVQQYTPNGGSAQRWTLTDAGGGYYYVRLDNGKALDVLLGSSLPGAKVQEWTFNGGSAQKWKLEHVRDGFYTLQAQCSGLNLEIAGGSGEPYAVATQNTPNVDSDAQLWRLVVQNP